jgi:hypothetical protein
LLDDPFCLSFHASTEHFTLNRSLSASLLALALTATGCGPDMSSEVLESDNPNAAKEAEAFRERSRNRSREMNDSRDQMRAQAEAGGATEGGGGPPGAGAPGKKPGG